MSHVAFILPGIDRLAGAERQAMMVAQGLRRRDWRVSLVALSGTGAESAEELEKHGVDFVSLGMRKGLADPRGWVRFAKFLRSARPDLVNAHLPHATWLARISRAISSAPVLIDTVHSCAKGGVSRRLAYRLTGSMSDCVTFVSRAAADAAGSAYQVPAAKLRVMPNCVDLSFWQSTAEGRKQARQDLGLADEFVWLAAGRLDPVKDYVTMLRAFAEVDGPAVLLVAGQGPLEAELRALAAALGIEERVRFLGFRKDLRPAMQAADGFVHSSLWEGLPAVLLEAAACRLPIVATDVPGTKEAVIAGETALLTTPGSPRDLAQAMWRVMRLPAGKLKAMGERGRQFVATSFDSETLLDRWESLYGELMLEKSNLLARRKRIFQSEA